jgi:hypothetical protein
MARCIVRFYVISPSHKTELLPRRKKCTPVRRSSCRAAWQGQNTVPRPGTLSALPLAGLFTRKRRKNPLETPYFPLKSQVLA